MEYNQDKNYGMIDTDGERFVLTGTQCYGVLYCFRSFRDCEHTFNGHWETGQEALDDAVESGGNVIEITGGQKAVVEFLMGVEE